MRASEKENFPTGAFLYAKRLVEREEELLMGEFTAFNRATLVLIVSGIGDKNQMRLSFSNLAQDVSKESLKLFIEAFETLTGAAVEDAQINTNYVASIQ